MLSAEPVAPNPPSVEPTPPDSAAVVHRLKRVAETGKAFGNRDRVIRALPSKVKQKYDTDPRYSLFDAVVDSALAHQSNILQEPGKREKFTDGLKQSLKQAGIDITDTSIPLDSLTRAY